MTSKKSGWKWSGRRPRSRRGLKGITLMEALLASALMSLVALGAFAAYGTSQTTLRQSFELSRLQGDAGFALRHLTKNLRQASGMLFDTVTEELKVTIPTDLNDPSVTRTMLYWRDRQIVSDPDDDVLRWAEDAAVPGTNQVLAHHVTAFTVAKAGNSAVTVTLTTAFGHPPFRQSYTLASTVTLRGRLE